jgi:hypothetical protein
LNASAINSPGIGDDDMSQEDAQYGGSKPNYDTQLGYQFVRPVQPRDQMSPAFQLSKFKATGPTNPQLNESNAVSCIMNRTYENRNCAANQ